MIGLGIACKVYYSYKERRNDEIAVELETECQICYENRVNVVFLGCYHAVTCAECAENLLNCPLCRVHIVRKIPIDELINK